MSIIVVVLVIAASLVVLTGLFLLAVHYGFKAPRIVGKGDPGDFGVKFKQVDIPARNGTKLFGWHILQSTKQAAPTVLIMHGWGVNAEVILPVALPFYNAGFNALLVDARNHGSSESDGHSSMPTFAEDIESGLDWLKTQPETGKIALLGHSVGAAARSEERRVGKECRL